MGGDRYEGRPEASTGFAWSVREARRIAQPASVSPNVTDIPYRAVSIYPSMIFARLGVTANQLTIFWVLLGIAGVVALGASRYSVQVTGAVLLEVSYLFDFIDGEVARLTEHTSSVGYLLDLAGHSVIKTAAFLAIGYGLFVSTHRYEMLILAFLACVGVSNGQLVPGFVAEAFPQTKRAAIAPAQTPPVRRSLPRRAISGAGSLFYSPGIYLLILLGAIFTRLDWVIVFYGVLGPLWLIYLLARSRP